MSSSSIKQVKEMEGGGFRLPGIPLTLYPTSDPNRVKIKMNDLAIKTCTTGRYIYSTTQPSPYYMMSPETLALRNKAASSSKFILHGFGPKKRPSAQQHDVATQPEETSSAAATPEDPSNINAASETAAPPTTSTEGQDEEAGGPVLKRTRLDPNPSAADSTATGSCNH